MNQLTYYALCLAAGLLLVALVSAGLTWLMRRREQALVLMEALNRHAVWVTAQRGGLVLDLRREEADAALQLASSVQSRWFRRLAPEFGALMAIDQRIEGFLLHQQRLRQSDPEAWLESDHDERFMALWREYLAAMEQLTARLQRMTREPIAFAQSPGA